MIKEIKAKFKQKKADADGFIPEDFNPKLTDDYEGRCGNCHAYMGENEKFCMYCGTRKGEGAFEPYENLFECVYGPPIKSKYKCQGCGHIWIVSTLGYGNSKYCPECGKAKIKNIEERVLDWSDAVALEEPFDSDDRPILFSSEEIMNILAEREKIEKPDRDWLNDDEVLSAMRKAGMNVPKKTGKSYPRTEKDAEQMNLAKSMLMMKGTKTSGYPRVSCPICNNDMLAGLSYDVMDSSGKTICKGSHMPSDEDALVYDTGLSVRESFLDSRDSEAYLCLSCGNRFGSYKKSKTKR